MKLKELTKKLDKTLLLLVAMVVIALAIALVTGGWQLAFDGFKQAGRLFDTVWLRLLLGFTLGGLITVIVPHALIARWLGNASGIKGILIGSYIGIISPGGPYVTLPIVASIYKAGAGVGPVIALLVGRALLSINILVVWQIPFFGVEIPLARYIACLFIPPLAGMAGSALFRVVNRLSGTANDTDATLVQEREGDTEKAL